jgi:hypothetical protein
MDQQPVNTSVQQQVFIPQQHCLTQWSQLQHELQQVQPCDLPQQSLQQLQHHHNMSQNMSLQQNAPKQQFVQQMQQPLQQQPAFYGQMGQPANVCGGNMALLCSASQFSLSGGDMASSERQPPPYSAINRTWGKICLYR